VAKVLLANAADIKAQDKVRAVPRAAAPQRLARICEPCIDVRQHHCNV